MGVKCSLLGHDYGDTAVERERAEQGDEVVRTAKRVERCHNCDHERTVSENTEVTALEAAAGVVREPDGTILAATDGMNEFDDVATDDDSSGERSESDGGVVIEKSEESASASDSSDTDADSMDENGADSIDEIRIDRSEIRTNRVERAPGEWPSEPDDEPTRVPKAMRDESAGLGSSGSLTVARTETGWPDETAAAPTRTRPPERQNATGNGLEISGTTTRRGKPVFACPSCGFSAVVTDSPLRAGDICPGCQHGYLAQETRKG